MVNFLPVDGTAAADCVLNCEGVPGRLPGTGVVLLVLFEYLY